MMNNDFEKYFQNSYETSREEFLNRFDLLKPKYHSVEHNSHRLPNKKDEDLFIDTVHIKTKADNEKLIILTSGVHGVETSVGSALQVILMDRLSSNGELFGDFDFLFVHAVNPWGAKHRRRVNENNVDLNRNFGVTEELFLTENKPYGALNHHLNPTKKVKTGFFNYFGFISKMLFQAIIKSKRFVSEAVGVGQYQFNKGVVFGGFKFQKEKEILHPIFEKTIARYKAIITVDLHTGLGKRGELHILNAPNSDKRIMEFTNALFNGTDDDDENFYKEHGAFLDFISSLCSNGQVSLPVMFEFGTIDTHTLRGGAKLLSNTCFENQGFHHGYSRKRDEKIKQDYQDMFQPSCNKWKENVVSKFIESIYLIPKNIDNMDFN